MSDLPEIRAEIDERGRMSYHATCEGVLLSKDEQKSIMRKFADLQHEVERLTTENANMLQHLRHVESENAKLRELCSGMHRHLLNRNTLLELLHFRLTDEESAAIADIEDRMRELGIEVGE